MAWLRLYSCLAVAPVSSAHRLHIPKLPSSPTGYPIPKPELIFRLEQGEAPWVPDSPRPQEGDIVTGVYTGASPWHEGWGKGGWCALRQTCL